MRFLDLLSAEIVSIIDFVQEDGLDAGEQVDGKHSGILIHSSMEAGLKDADTLILNDPGTTFGGNKGVIDALGNPLRLLLTLGNTHDSTVAIQVLSDITLSDSAVRHVVECFFNKLKQFRGIATRYDELSRNFLSFAFLASVMIC